MTAQARHPQVPKPTEQNTIAEITAYLDEQGIDHSGVTLKADLLALIPE